MFIDINMPIIGGIELVKLIKDLESEGKLDLSNSIIVALTTLDRRSMSNYKELGFHHHVLKPLTRKCL